MRKPRHNQFKYSRGERKAERELDEFLRKVNGANQLDIMQQLRRLSLH